MREKIPRTWRKKGVWWRDAQAQAGRQGHKCKFCMFQSIRVCTAVYFCWWPYVPLDLSVPLEYSFIQSVFIEGLLCARPVRGARRQSIEWNMCFWVDLHVFLWTAIILRISESENVCGVFVYFCVSLTTSHVHDSDCFSSAIFRGLPFICCVHFAKSGLYLFDFYNLKEWGYDH